MVCAMGWGDVLPGPRRLEAARRHADLEAARSRAAVAPMQVGLASPMAHDSATLNAVVWADLEGAATLLSRPAVMAIPAIARQRHLLAGSLARCPLVVLRGATTLPDADQPTWCYRTDGELSPYHRMLWTADDLLFHGWSLWRAGRGTEGQLLTAERIPTERWGTDVADRILIDGELADAAEVLLIPGPHEGILHFGAAALRRMIDNLDAAAVAARNPSAYLELHYTGEEPLTDPQIDKLIGRWADARKGLNGGVSYTGRNIELKEHGTHESHLLIEGRNADAVDASRLVSSPAAMADATAAGASLTYETTSGRNSQFLDYGVSLYMDAIAARLSMDDVVARGLRTAFDTTPLSGLTPAPTGTGTLD
jgi:hypothetical protein